MTPGAAGRRLAVPAFFAAVLIVGLALFRDYGVSWDEHYQRRLGHVALGYALGTDDTLPEFTDRYYGTAFEMLLAASERLLGDSPDSRRVVFLRHFLTFLSFWGGLVFFYLLCRRLFGSRRMALLGCLMLLLSPRIFAHAFYNSKDIPFLSLFIASVYTLVRLIEKPTLSRAAAHALAGGLLIAVRVPGVVIVPLTVAAVAADARARKTGCAALKTAAPSYFFCLVLLPAVTVLFWPTLWRDPLGEFIAAFRTMSAFPGSGSVLYRGAFIPTDDLPWHYVPLWICITTPPAILALFAAGATDLAAASRRFREAWRRRSGELIAAAWLAVPLAAVIVLRSVLYDGWRQMFFVYPAIAILALSGLRALRERFRPAVGTASAAVLAVGLLASALAMARLHPLEAVYFNSLAGSDLDRIKESYELDYWGLSYRRALEELLARDRREQISVKAAHIPGWTNSLVLAPEERRRLTFVEDEAAADYFITNYRWHPAPYPGRKEIYSLEKGGAKIVTVFRAL